jgi:hypothetical protein
MIDVCAYSQIKARYFAIRGRRTAGGHLQNDVSDPKRSSSAAKQVNAWQFTPPRFCIANGVDSAQRQHQRADRPVDIGSFKPLAEVQGDKVRRGDSVCLV